MNAKCQILKEELNFQNLMSNGQLPIYFFSMLCRFLNSSNLSELIQILNTTIHSYFEENFGYSDEVYHEELIRKDKDMPKRSLKSKLKFLKQIQASPFEIKYVSRLLRNKLRNTTVKPTSGIYHNEQIKKNF